MVLDVKDTYPLRWLLEQDYSRGVRFAVPLEINREQWLAELSRQQAQPGIQGAPTSYAFPLYCVHSPSQEPLGCVVLDMVYMGEKNLSEILSTTRVVLELVSEILAFRYDARRSQEWLILSMGLVHNRGLKERWDALHDCIVQLCSAWSERDEIAVSRRMGMIGKSAAHVNLSMSELLTALDKIDQRSKDGEERCISDLADFIGRVAEAMKGRYPESLDIAGSWDQVKEFSLSCRLQSCRMRFIASCKTRWVPPSLSVRNASR